MKNNEVVNQYHKSSVAHSVSPRMRTWKKEKKWQQLLRTLNLWKISWCFLLAVVVIIVRNRLTDLNFSSFHQIETILRPSIGPINWIRWNRRLKASINYPESIRIKFKLRFGFNGKLLSQFLIHFPSYMLIWLIVFPLSGTVNTQIPNEISYDAIIYCESIAFEIAIVGIKSLKFICRYLFNWMQLLEMPMPGYLYAITNEQTMHCSIRWALTGCKVFFHFVDFFFVRLPRWICV